MPRYRVTLTRLVEEEATIYVQAATKEHADEKALELVGEPGEIADSVWLRSDAEPHSYSVECEDSQDVDIRNG
jgi:non-ribosomal peptide synthetase component E (peptide arylation enzyme)